MKRVRGCEGVIGSNARSAEYANTMGPVMPVWVNMEGPVIDEMELRLLVSVAASQETPASEEIKGARDIKDERLGARGVMVCPILSANA